MTPPAGTKERILDAAFVEFTKRGFAGARVDEIAGRAKCNKALLYQHYGDKEALFKHVLELKMQQMRGIATDDPERFPEVIGEFFDFHAANPWITKLMLWEALDFGGKPVPNESERAKHLATHVADLERFQRQGLVDPDLDARMTLMTLIGMTQIWFALPQLARMVTGANPYTPEALKRRREHVIQAAKKMLEVH
ncbi:MAG: TetR/AcrR family transcriptional regulator [Actinomycetota bacterium]